MTATSTSTATADSTSTRAPAPPGSRPGRRRRAVGWLGAAVAVVAMMIAAGSLLAAALRPHLYAGTVLRESTSAPSLDGLVFTDGRPADLRSLDGDVTLVFFGYTNCPDVCPTTLATAARALDRLGDRGDDVNVVLVSVDPARDDPATLRDYVGFFDPRFLGATGAPDDVQRAASAFGVYYQQGEGTPETGYTVDHTASLIGIGPDGALRIVWTNDVPAEALAADLADLLP